TKTLTVPPPPTSPERRLPLRQQPSERSFSASPRNVDPVRNDWVLPHLKPQRGTEDISHKKAQKAHKHLLNEQAKFTLIFSFVPFVPFCGLLVLCLFVALPKFVTLPVTLSVFLRQKLAF
ncbi:MAG TPA: hypothetical protein VF290_06755, partial [Pyrinomonadaceae bacterium]